MTTMPQLHVTEVAHEAFVEGVHQVETMASHAMHGIGREADHMLDVVRAPVTLAFSGVEIEARDYDTDIPA